MKINNTTTKTLSRTLPNLFVVEAGLILVLAALMIMSLPFSASAASLYRQLEMGMSGTDVSDLQTFLAQDPSIYPEGLVTGYFGRLTFAAVTRFQTRNGISTVGRVGPITMAAINAQMAGGIVGGADLDAPTIFGVGVSRNSNSSTVSWNTNELARGVVYYSASPLIEYERLHSVDISGSAASTDNNLRTSQNVVINGLQANTIYYYLIYVTDTAGNVSVTLPATFRTI